MWIKEEGSTWPTMLPRKWSIAMKVRDVMTSPVISVAPDSTVLEAVRIMLQRHISGLPVIEKGGELVGIVTEGDFLRRAETGTQRRRPRWLEYLVGPGRLADEYTRSHGRKVYEIMTFGALTVTEDTPLDEVVRLMEKRRIKRLPVVRGTAVVGIVSVRDGVVELWGAITDERERAAIIVAAENAPGVKSVNDHLAWVEPMSGMAFSPSDEGMVQAKAS